MGIMHEYKIRYRRKFMKKYNFFVDLLRKRHQIPSDLAELNEIREKTKERTDISDYLETIFIESVSMKPRLILELGVRGGESSFVFERVAKVCGSRIVSVDIDDCLRVISKVNCTFVHKDDIEFAKEFIGWCKERGIEPVVDLLFIDTSHVYSHTVQEIKSWFPFLSERAKVIFHDTNLRWKYFRKDGSIGFAWNNERGVIRAIEEYLNVSFDEKRDFHTIVGEWAIRHYACCNGLTVLDRLDFMRRR
jgi:cephalosporin hydroxylase